MIKSVLKEIIIILLLCFATILIFGIVFYDYVPVSKVVPNKVAYNVSDEIKEELDEEVSEQEIRPQEITYSVTSSDLKVYQSATVYQPGNPNPFHANSSGSADNTVTDNNTIGGSTSGNTQNGTQYYYPTNTSTK